MARAAVKAKQAQQAQAVTAAARPSRKQRKHASGGNPNQDLFFSRLRRRQKWVFVGLALVFALSFVLLGVGSGNGNGLEQAVKSWFTSGNDPVAQAQKEIRDGKTRKGYIDLANAYTAKEDLVGAARTLEAYLKIDRKDSAAWAQLGGLKMREANQYRDQYQQVQQASQLEAPSSIFQPTGDLASQLGTNPIDEYYTKQNQALLAPLGRNLTTGYTDSLAAYKQAAKYAKPADRPTAELAVYSAALNAGQTKDGLAALKRYVRLAPDASNIKQIEQACKQLGGSCPPPKLKRTQ